ncbi:putative exported protein [Roseibium sp. TrichSKD4]|nr:putative exported protein [Roseibium sp. TrichSKD4]
MYIACAGFVAAGVLGSLYQLLTKEPPRFNFSIESLTGIVSGIFMVLFAGPFIIMRNAIRGRRIENRPLGWLVASSTIAGMWSLCSGLLVVQVALGLAHSLA